MAYDPYDPHGPYNYPTVDPTTRQLQEIYNRLRRDLAQNLDAVIRDAVLGLARPVNRWSTPLLFTPEPDPPPMEEPVSTVQVVVGYRKWEVDSHKKFLVTNNRFIWPHLEPAVKLCSRAEKCDGAKCACGFYAWAAPDKNENQIGCTYREGYAVGGSVSLWGTVYEHERGFRGQYAYPKCFYANEKQPWLGEIAARYGVPIEDAPWSENATFSCCSI